MATEPAAEATDVEAPARKLTTTPTASKTRSPHDLLAETRASVEEVAARILAIKKDGVPKSELRELVAQMSLLLITLRQVNREILMEEDKVKGETEAAKAPVDSTTLKLHNLLYEKNHYVKAIRSCLDFQTKHPGIELVPEEEFHRAAPADIRDKTLAADAAHDLMLKRLNFELVQRKELCERHEKLEQQKSSLLGTIANQKKFLSSLPSHLKSLKKASLPVQQQLGMLHTKKLKQHHAAELLPSPLYITYTQLLGQKEAFGENIDVEITGSTKDAQTSAQQQAKQENGTLSSDDNNRMDDDAIDDEEDAQRRRSRSRKNLVKEASNPALAYQLHPLKVVLHVYDTEDSGTKRHKLITLRFEYLAKLNVVCVGTEDSEGMDNNILCNLFPDDTGLELPHQMAKLYAGETPNFSEKDSRPYKWAQHLAGIDFLPEVPQYVGDDSNRALRSADLSSGLVLYTVSRIVHTLQRELSDSVPTMQSVQALASSLDALPPEFVRSEHEQPGATTFGGAATPEVPVIDMAEGGARMADAAREWGLFQVVNHGVPAEAVADLQRVGRGFFALPQEEKERYAMDPASGRLEGYGSKLQRDLEGKKTWADFFFHNVAPPAMVNHDIWPKNPHGYREANEEYCRHMQRLTRELFKHLSAGLGLEKGAMWEAFGCDDVVLLQKINFYPPCPQPELALGVAPHTDMSTLTILVPNEVQGLQVFKDSHWYDVEYVPGALIIHIGDQIEILSNGRYKAVLHRTTVNKEKTRMSWPVFVEPPMEHVVGPHRQLVTDESPAKYKAKKFKDYQYCKINKLPQ